MKFFAGHKREYYKKYNVSYLKNRLDICKSSNIPSPLKEIFINDYEIILNRRISHINQLLLLEWYDIPF